MSERIPGFDQDYDQEGRRIIYLTGDDDPLETSRLSTLDWLTQQEEAGVGFAVSSSWFGHHDGEEESSTERPPNVTGWAKLLSLLD